MSDWCDCWGYGDSAMPTFPGSSRPSDACSAARCGPRDDRLVAVLLPSPDATTPAAPAAETANPVTPGDFTGYGFDQCLAARADHDERLAATTRRSAPSASTSPGSRAPAADQPNLTPTWVSTQLTKGWRLLPITLGPQASCQPRFPRYGDDLRSAPSRARPTATRRAEQGTAEAATSVAAAQALGIVPGSTLWYDLEGYDFTNTNVPRVGAVVPERLDRAAHALGYVSGVYSSAGSGIKSLDDARVLRPGAFALPDQIWIARWDGVANTSTSYIRDDGWRPGGRIKQYQGGHDETWGGVKINIDRNYLDLGARPRCRRRPRRPRSAAAPRSTSPNYPRLKAPTARARPDAGQVAVLKCLLKEQGAFTGKAQGRVERAADQGRQEVAEAGRAPHVPRCSRARRG